MDRWEGQINYNGTEQRMRFKPRGDESRNWAWFPSQFKTVWGLKEERSNGNSSRETAH